MQSPHGSEPGPAGANREPARRDRSRTALWAYSIVSLLVFAGVAYAAGEMVMRLTAGAASAGATPTSTAPPPLPTPQPAVPTAPPAAAPPPTQAAPPPTSNPAASAPGRRYVVGNTGGDGVFLRRTTRRSDTTRAFPDGTVFVGTGRAERNDGLDWLEVRAPDGEVGWIPTQYLLPG